MKQLGLQKKITLLFVVFAILLSTATGLFTYFMYKRSVKNLYSQNSIHAVETVATTLKGDQIKQYATTLTKDETYNQIFSYLQIFKKNQNLAYLYIFVPDEEKITYIFDIYTTKEEKQFTSDLGEIDYHDNETIYQDVMSAYQKGETTNKFTVSKNRYGYLASSYAPIFDSSGAVCAVVGADISMDTILAQANSYIIVAVTVTIVLISIFLFILLHICKKRIIAPIESLTESAKNFVENGDRITFKKLSIHTQDEIQTLSESFNKMSDDLTTYIDNLAKATAEKERIATELHVAKQIQRSMLPSTFPAYPNRAEFDIYASMVPAKEVGGDFYDFFLVGMDKLAFIIADVSGKGVPAALLMMSTRALIKNQVLTTTQLDEVLYTVNNQMCDNNEAGMFITAFLAVLDLKTGLLSYCNAGHNPPLLKRETEPFHWLKAEHNFILGGIPNKTYQTHQITLQNNDVVFLYTDGVTEATDKNSNLYSSKRLIKELNAPILSQDSSCKVIVTHIQTAVDQFSSGIQQTDDITMLCVKYLNKKF